MSSYFRGNCIVCGVRCGLERGCAPLCGSRVCDAEYDARTLEEELSDSSCDRSSVAKTCAGRLHTPAILDAGTGLVAGQFAGGSALRQRPASEPDVPASPLNGVGNPLSDASRNRSFPTVHGEDTGAACNLSTVTGSDNTTSHNSLLAPSPVLRSGETPRACPGGHFTNQPRKDSRT